MPFFGFISSRSRLRRPHRPFIFATGYSTSALPAEFNDRPALQKPFQIEMLGKLIEVALKSHREGASSRKQLPGRGTEAPRLLIPVITVTCLSPRNRFDLASLQMFTARSDFGPLSLGTGPLLFNLSQMLRPL